MGLLRTFVVARSVCVVARGSKHDVGEADASRGPTSGPNVSEPGSTLLKRPFVPRFAALFGVASCIHVPLVRTS